MPSQLKPEHLVLSISKPALNKVYTYLDNLIERDPKKLIFKQFFILVRYTGARLGGAVSIKRKHVDLVDWKLTLFEKGRGGKKKMRVIPIFPVIRELLEELCFEVDDEDYLFEKYYELYQSSRKVQDFIVMQNQMHLNWSMHNLRKTIGGELLELGWTMKQVSVFLGHSSVSVTEQWYVSDIDLVGSGLGSPE